MCHDIPFLKKIDIQISRIHFDCKPTDFVFPSLLTLILSQLEFSELTLVIFSVFHYLTSVLIFNLDF